MTDKIQVLEVVNGLRPEVYDFDAWKYLGPPRAPIVIHTYDPNGRDGEWYAVVTLPYEHEEWEGHVVPVFEGDVERLEWERARRR